MYPEIYLAIDNCFGSKRYTAPDAWARVIRDLGLKYVEASADTECDPLYMGGEYLSDWPKAVRLAEEKHDIKVANLYSGHGTYATLGLAHTDAQIRERFLNSWLKPMAEIAGEINAGLGFFCHAFCEEVLESPKKYREFEEELYRSFALLASYAKQRELGPLGVEQMYSPNQIPFTIDGAEKLMRRVFALSGAPFYITIDTGHQTGQARFVRPRDLRARHAKYMADGGTQGLHLGSSAAFGEFLKPSPDYAKIEALMDEREYMFAEELDGDVYLWLSRLGCYSPIIHLQQTDGRVSAHLPFTQENNERGIIEPSKILAALRAAYDAPADASLPPRARRIYLTLEMFTGTAELSRDSCDKIAESVEYFRRFIPKDGLRLDELI